MNTEEYLNGYYSISKQNDENNAITNPVEIHYVESYAKEYLKNINNDSDEMFKTKYLTEYQNYNKKEIIKYSALLLFEGQPERDFMGISSSVAV